MPNEPPTSVSQLYHPWPKQWEALWLLGLLPGMAPPDNTPTNLMLFGGQAGGSKSTTLRIIAANRAIALPGSRFCIVRQKFPELLQNHAAPFKQEIPESVARFNITRMELEWWNGSVTELHHCAEATSHLDYKGFEWPAGLGADEAVDLTEEQLLYFFTRVRGDPTRWPNQNWHKLGIFASNPLGPSHQYLKRTFVDGQEPGVPFLGPAQEMEDVDGKIIKRQFRYCFLRSELRDNPSLDYIDTMAGILSNPDERRRRAEAFGDWDIPGGNFFSTFDRNLHVIQPFAIPENWTRWRAVDWGFASPTACLWAARNPETRQIIVYREWGASQVSTAEQAIAIVNQSYGERIVLTAADPMYWSRRGAVGGTFADVYRDNGVPLTQANNRRQMGWARINQALSHEEAMGPGIASRPPELQIFNTCPKLINELTNLQVSDKPGDWDDLKEPQNLTDQRDDFADCARYLVMAADAIARPEPEVRTYRTVDRGAVLAAAERRRRRISR